MSKQRLKIDDIEYINAARAYYKELCLDNPLWRHMPGGLIEGGCGSFEAWFMISDGPKLRRLLGEE